jgi:hypothetical protein
MAIANCNVGPGTVTVGGTAILTEGVPVGGLESDIALNTPDSLVVPADAVVTSLIPYIKFTSIECDPATLDDLWALVDAAGGPPITSDVGVPTTKTIKATVVVVQTTDVGVYTIAEGVAMEFGEITPEKGAYIKADALYKGISTDGATAAATYAAPA